MTLRILDIVRSKIGAPYRWGAAGPSRFDCSGLIIWALIQLGVRLSARFTAAMFWNRCSRVAVPAPGRLCYWRNRAGRIFHVAVVSRVEGAHFWAIGAHGGGPTTTTDDAARQQGAQVFEKRFKVALAAGFTMLPGEAQPRELPDEPEPGEESGDPPEDWV